MDNMLRFCCAGEKAAAKAEDTTGSARASPLLPPPLPVASLPPAAAAAAAPFHPDAPSPLPSQKEVSEETAAALGTAPEEKSLNADLDLAALAALGDDEQLAALLEKMLRGGDELFARVFERVDGAVTQALMASAASAAAEGAGGAAEGGERKRGGRE